MIRVYYYSTLVVMINKIPGIKIVYLQSHDDATRKV
jgi:hypothetical protein